MPELGTSGSEGGRGGRPPWPTRPTFTTVKPPPRLSPGHLLPLTRDPPPVDPPTAPRLGHRPLPGPLPARGPTGRRRDLLPQHPVDRRTAQPRRPCDRRDPHPLPLQPTQDRLLLRRHLQPTALGRPAPDLARLPRRRLPGHDPLGPDPGLVCRDARQDVGHQPARRRLQVQAVLQADQVHPAGQEVLEQGREPLGGAAQSVEPPDHDAGHLAGLDLLDQAVEAGPVHGLAGELVAIPADGLVVGLGLGPALQVGLLALGVLGAAGDAEVDGGVLGQGGPLGSSRRADRCRPGSVTAD
jgi:hypothetical protein